MDRKYEPNQIAILVRLHAILRALKPAEPDGGIRLYLPEGATISDAISALELPKMEMVYSLNSKMVGEEAELQTGDELDIIPAISGGSPGKSCSHIVGHEKRSRVIASPAATALSGVARGGRSNDNSLK